MVRNWRQWGAALVALVGVLPGVALAQLTDEERGGVAATLSLINMGLNDLKYEKKIVQPGRSLPVTLRGLDDPLGVTDDLLAFHAGARADRLAPLLSRSIAFAYGQQVTAGSPAAPVGAWAELPPKTRAIVARLVGALQAADGQIREATKDLTAQEQRQIIEGLPVYAVEEPKVTFGFVRGQTLGVDPLFRLVAKADLARIRQAAHQVAVAADGALSELKTVGEDVPGKVRLKLGSYVVVVAGKGADLHDDLDARLTIDLGGDDRYVGRHGAGVGYASLLIDVAGDDAYDVPDLNLGAGALGIGLAYDLAGHDSFRTRSVALGSGIAGVGGFLKLGGNDRYDSVALSQGFAIEGVGVCADTQGAETYRLGLFGQGAARTGGVGWLLDGSGDDTYDAGSISLNQPLFTGVFYSFAQGMGMGERQESGGLGGGVGLLTDASGRDLYRVDTYGQGAGYWFGIGSLGDLGGNDTYSAHHYAQGSAMHLTYASLFDLGGDDAYVTRVGASHAIGHDYGVAVLLDRAGDDTYSSRDSNPGIGSANGLGLFVDGAGLDRYHGPAGRGLAARGTGSLGLFVDLSGQDLYRFGLADDQARTRETWGAAYDVDTPLVASQPAAARPTPPTPGSIPKPSDAELERIYRLASQWGVGSAQAEVERNVNQLIGIGEPAFAWMVETKLAGIDRFQTRTFGAVARALGAPASRLLVARAFAGSDTEKSNALRVGIEAGLTDLGALVPSLLESPGTQALAIRAAGELKATAAVPGLMRLCLTGQPLVVRAAAISLGQIGDPAAVATGQALAGSADPMTRQAAVQIVAAGGNAAIPAAKTLIADADERKARVGAGALGVVGTPEALRELVDLLLDPRPGLRVEALRQLAGRVPGDALPTIISLQRDPDPLVRAMAKGVSP